VRARTFIPPGCLDLNKQLVLAFAMFFELFCWGSGRVTLNPDITPKIGLLPESAYDPSAYVPQKVWVTLSSGLAGMPNRSQPGLSSYGRDTTSKSSSNG
jgi:hypothetical protein